MKIRKRKTFQLRLTKFELVHLRDLFSIRLPPELKQTVSQALAKAEDRLMVEARLWQKLVDASREAELPLDDDAPDFICAANSAPSIGIFRLAQEPNENAEQAEEGGNLFDVESDEEDDDEKDDEE